MRKTRFRPNFTILNIISRKTLALIQDNKATFSTNSLFVEDIIIPFTLLFIIPYFTLFCKGLDNKRRVYPKILHEQRTSIKRANFLEYIYKIESILTFWYLNCYHLIEQEKYLINISVYCTLLWICITTFNELCAFGYICASLIKVSILKDN